MRAREYFTHNELKPLSSDARDRMNRVICTVDVALLYWGNAPTKTSLVTTVNHHVETKRE